MQLRMDSVILRGCTDHQTSKCSNQTPCLIAIAYPQSTAITLARFCILSSFSNPRIVLVIEMNKRFKSTTTSNHRLKTKTR